MAKGKKSRRPKRQQRRRLSNREILGAGTTAGEPDASEGTGFYDETRAPRPIKPESTKEPGLAQSAYAITHELATRLPYSAFLVLLLILWIVVVSWFAVQDNNAGNLNEAASLNWEGVGTLGIKLALVTALFSVFAVVGRVVFWFRDRSLSGF